MSSTTHALEVRAASLWLLVRSLSRPVPSWLGWGVHMFLVTLPGLNSSFRTPQDAVRLFMGTTLHPTWLAIAYMACQFLPLGLAPTISDLAPASVATLAVPMFLGRVQVRLAGGDPGAVGSPLDGSFDRLMHGIVWLFLKFVVYPRVMEHWVVLYVTYLAGTTLGWIVLVIFMGVATFESGFAMIYNRIFQLGGYLTTKLTIARATAQYNLSHAAEILRRDGPVRRELLLTVRRETAQQVIIHIGLRATLKLLVDEDIRLLHGVSLVCWLAAWFVLRVTAVFEPTEWDGTPIIMDQIPPTTPEYTHTPLPPDGRTIRLLLLHPRASSKSVIRATLIPTPLDRAPRFEAISYTWGSSATTGTILIDSQSFHVTANAFRLLQDLSSPLLPRLLWIDAICIDQASVDEKTRQVRLMADIFRRAAQVTVWLGHPYLSTTSTTTTTPDTTTPPPPPPQTKPPTRRQHLLAHLDAAHAFHTIHHLARHNTFHPPNAKASIDLSLSGRRRGTGSQDGGAALGRLTHNPWFERLWVVQEVVLGGSVRVKYGGKVEMGWGQFVGGLGTLVEREELRGLAGAVRGYGSGLGGGGDGKGGGGAGGAGEGEEGTAADISPAGVAKMDCLALMMVAKEEVAEKGRIRFDDALFMGGRFKAKDARDHIFGLVGLFGADPEGRAAPDYSLGADEVYFRAACRLIREEGVARALSLAGIGYYDEGDTSLSVSERENLPSWVADWSRPRFNPLFIRTQKEKTPYAAGGPSVGDGSGQHIQIGRMLHVRGHIFDEVERLGPVLKVHIPEGGVLDAFEGLEEHFGSLVASWSLLTAALDGRFGGVYPLSTPPMPLFEAFWRLLIGDRTTGKRPAPASLGQGWIRLVQAMLIKPIPAMLEAAEVFREHGVEVREGTYEDYVAAMPYAKAMGAASVGRRVGVTRNGYIGLFPPLTRVGDAVAVVEQAPTLFTLRPLPGSQRAQGSQPHFRLVGETFVLGAMDGEALPAAGEWSLIEVV